MNIDNKARRGLVAAALTGLLLVAGCSGVKHDVDPTQPSAAGNTQTKTPPPTLTTLNPDSVDQTDPDATAIAVATTAYSYAPGKDKSPNDGMKRAAPLLTRELSEAIDKYQPATGPGAQWESWALHNAVVVATAEIGNEPLPPAASGATNLQVLITQSVNINGEVSPASRVKILITMTKTPQGYRVSSLQQTGI